MAALRLATHDSGSGWFATPFLYDSFIHNSMPVYPGALLTLLENTAGAGNTATGMAALVLNGAGSSNTATGVDSLFSNNTGAIIPPPE